MEVFISGEWFGNSFVRALSWMLIHSLWQGAAAAVIAGIVILFTKRSGALLRYNMLCCIFLLVLLSAITSFIVEYVTFSKENVVRKTVVTKEFQNFNFLEGDAGTLSADKGSITAIVNFFDVSAPLIILIWLIIFCIHFIKLIKGFNHIKHIRSQHVSPPSEQWKDKLHHLSDLLGIRQTVFFLQSRIVDVPVVIGFLKPTLLIPIGLLSNLPCDQVETILMHELAHIRRKDYLVNVIQSLVETIFFFNPAIKWISDLIRYEREACCDDVVVAHTSNKVTYLQALISFQEYSLQKKGYSLALSGPKNSLLNRIKRLLTYENNKLNMVEKLFLVSGLIVFTSFNMISFNDKNNTTNTVNILNAAQLESSVVATTSDKGLDGKKKDINPTVVPEIGTLATAQDTVDSEKKYSLVSIKAFNKISHITIRDDKGKTYWLKKVNDRVKELHINSVRIPKYEMHSYTSFFEAVNLMVKKKEKMVEIYKEKIGEKITHADVLRRKTLDFSKQIEIQKRDDDKKLKLRQIKIIDSINSSRIQTIIPDLQKNLAHVQRGIDTEIKTSKLKNLEDVFKKIQVGLQITEAKTEATRQKVATIIDELKKENIIKRTNRVSFLLNETELIVNGKVQSTEIHNKFKYLLPEGRSISYSKRGI